MILGINNSFFKESKICILFYSVFTLKIAHSFINISGSDRFTVLLFLLLFPFCSSRYFFFHLDWNSAIYNPYISCCSDHKVCITFLALVICRLQHPSLTTPASFGFRSLAILIVWYIITSFLCMCRK